MKISVIYLISINWALDGFLIVKSLKTQWIVTPEKNFERVKLKHGNNLLIIFFWNYTKIKYKRIDNNFSEKHTFRKNKF